MADPESMARERARVARVLAGDGEALDAWFRGHHPAVYRLCLGFLADASEAEDAAQDAMVHLLQRLAQWQAGRGFEAWRNAVVLNLCRDRRRRTRRRQRAEREAASVQPQAVPLPEEGMHRAETRRVLERALAVLPDREREAFVLRDLEGAETAEVAEAMGVSASSVRSLTTLARRRLRALLAGRLWIPVDGVRRA